MKKRESWGTVLIIIATLVFWWGSEVWEPSGSDADGRRLVFYFHGVTGISITGWTEMISIIAGVIGALMLVPSLIQRIHLEWLRVSVICLAIAAALPATAFLAVMFLLGFMLTGDNHHTRFEAADGRSVLVVQGWFDADGVDIYTKHDDTHYVYNRDAHILSGFPRVEDRNCRLDAAEEMLLLACGPDIVAISPR